MLNFMKIRPVGAELFPADRQTDRYDGGISHFSHFFERAKKKQNKLLFLIEGRSRVTHVADVFLEKDACLVSTVKIRRIKINSGIL
jgi:hypothetical protein